MSPSPRSQDSADDDSDYRNGWHQVAQMVVDGYSWSGNERHCCFLNTGGSHFANASFASGFDLKDDGRGLALVDWDRDGDLDCWINNRTGPQVRLLRNDSSAGNRHLTLRLVGTECNRDALGARVTLKTSGEESQAHVRTVRAGTGFLSQSARTLHFGLGSAERVEQLTILWPGGDEDTVQIPEVNRSYVVVQGSRVAVAEKPSDSASSLQAAASEAVSPQETGRRIVIGATRVPRSITCQSVDGEEIRLSSATGQPLLVTLWSPTCASCLVELKELAESVDDIHRHQLRIIAVTPDEGNTESVERAQQVLQRLGGGFELALASEEQLQLFDRLQKINCMRQRSLVLPTGFLIDEAGHLTAVYRGPVTTERLLADVSRMAEGPGMIMHEALPFSGRLHPDSLIARAGILKGAGHPQRALADVNAAIKMQPLVADHFRAREAVYRALGEWDLAVEDASHAKWLSRLPRLNRAVAANPQSPSVRLERANYLVRGGDLNGALRDYDQVLQLDEDCVEALLGAAEVRLTLKQFRRAVEDCERAMELGAGFDALSIRGDCYYSQGDFERALADYEQAGRFDCWVADCYLQRSRSRRTAGDKAGADRDYRTAVQMDPTLEDSETP